MHRLSPICALLVLSSIAAPADEFRLENGYISVHGSGGVIRDLRVDPQGNGDYGRVLAREIYVGDELQEPSNANLPFELKDDTVTFENVRVCSNPREFGVTEPDTAVRLTSGETLGQLFALDANGMVSVSVCVPTWQAETSAMTLRLYKDGPDGELIAERRCENIPDNSWQSIVFPGRDKGTYYLEMSEPRGPVGWWTRISGPRVGTIYTNGKPLDVGSRTFRAKVCDIFPATMRISLVGAKLFAEAQPDEERRVFNWYMVTPFERDGFETRDPERIPFSRFYSDIGQYMPIAQLKRRDLLDFGMLCREWFHATGNGPADLRIGMRDDTLMWEMQSNSMKLKLGKDLAIAVQEHSDEVPRFYPVFYSSDPAFDGALNSFFYDRAYSWPIAGVNADWFEWMALIHFWNYRPESLAKWREKLLTYNIGDDGYVYTWGESIGWPFPDNEVYDTRHFTTNPCFILACYRFYTWTGDRDFLESNKDRLRSAMSFLLTELKGSDGILVLPDKDHGGTVDDVPSNYWDDLPFGGRSAYVNTYFYAALGAMASIERALGNEPKAKECNDLRALCHEKYNQLFWNDAAGRYIGCIDENGVVHDYGFTYVNMEAMAYGLPSVEQARRIYHWMEHEPTSSGKTDTYARFRFAPRVNTIDCKDWWYLRGEGEIKSQPFDTHLENGGAILFTSGYDMMARARYLGGDSAFRRLREILTRYQEPDRLCGGSPLRYGEVNGWQVGTDVPFPESGLAPASFVHAILGLQATIDGLLIKPHLPTELEFAGVRNLRYHGLMLDVSVTRDTVTIKCFDPGHRFSITEPIPADGYLFKLPE